MHVLHPLAPDLTHSIGLAGECGRSNKIGGGAQKIHLLAPSFRNIGGVTQNETQ